jgi:hypothetical protein
VSSRTFIRIYSPDELSQKIIGSNELSLNVIKVTRFRENKRSDEVTKKATTPPSMIQSAGGGHLELRPLFSGVAN